MARTIKFASYLMRPGELPVYEGLGGPVFHFSGGSWRLLEPVGVRFHPDEANELCGDSKYELLTRFFGAIAGIPDGLVLALAAVRAYHQLLGGGGSVWVLQFALVGLPGIQLEDEMDRRVIELPSWIRLEPEFTDELQKALLVEDVMEA